MGLLHGDKTKIFTGSKDRYLKMYSISTGEGLFKAEYEFASPHYDSVTAVVAYGDSLFSASKDAVRFFRFMFSKSVDYQASTR